MGSNVNPNISPLEVIGLSITVVSFLFENTADSQKRAWIAKMKKAQLQNKVCMDGLWSLCRHPNYFGEWMVWNGLTIASIPSILEFSESNLMFYTLIGSFAAIVYMMYDFLVYQTGAMPAEFFSEQKRPDYKNYQATTNMFFPGLSKLKKQ